MQTNAFKKRRGGAEQLTYQTFLLTHLATISINAVMEEHVEEATGQVHLVSTSKTSRKKRKWETIKDQGPPLLEVEEDQPPEKKVYLLI